MSANFDELLTFPTVFVFRIIAYQKDGIVEKCREVLENVFSKIEGCKIIPSKTNRFVRIQIAVVAVDGEQLYKGYDILKEVEGIRMVF